MYLIPFLHFFAFTAYVALGIFVYTRDRRSTVNRAGVTVGLSR